MTTYRCMYQMIWLLCRHVSINQDLLFKSPPEKLDRRVSVNRVQKTILFSLRKNGERLTTMCCRRLPVSEGERSSLYTDTYTSSEGRGVKAK